MPFYLAPERPGDPGLVGALDGGMGVKRPPTLDATIVAVALHENRPEVTRLVVAIRNVALGVAEEGPEKIFVDETGAFLAGVKRQDADLAGGRGAGGSIGARLLGVAPDQRPEGVASLELTGAIAPAKKWPKGEALLPAAREPQEWPWREDRAGLVFIHFSVEWK